uniref:At1g61320/AtMIF1 LRR domain-containing protein n=1 Tax=Oryza sativa subsp. japonica TaxID=39947 RepID=Q6K7S1_ORYSJ|nr:hypothetical protein [Oryza sativa Japonica Group]
MTFFYACTDAFAGLTRLHLRNLKLAETDIPNIIATCKRLEYLRLSMCQTEDSVLQLQVEHPRLAELDISSAGLELVELNSLPNLKRLVFSLWLCPQEPLSFGNIPLLSSLSLTNVSMRWQKVIRLSQFLSSAPTIRDLHLSFLSEKIWVQPECPKLLSPVLQNLQVLNLDELPEGRDIAWTCFFLEAAPSLKEVCITVWDHWCDMETDSVEREEQGFCEKTNVEWESSTPDGFRHYNLTKLTIYGFQPNENFMGYIRHVMEAAVNLEDISLYDRKVLECCEDLDPKIKVAPSGYPETIQEQELLKKQITEGLVMASPHIIHFRGVILSTPDAVRTCLLSKRTIHLRHLLSNLDISVDSFVPHYYGYYATSKDAIQIQMNAAVSDATDNILNFRNQEIPLRQLTICFYLKYYDCLTIGKTVARAMATHSHNLDSAEFSILTGKRAQHCSIDDLRHNGKQLMTFFGACTDAFAGLTRLHLRNLRLAETDILNIIATCKRLEYLRLSMCQTEDSVLQMKFEHPRLVELNISSAGLELVELSSLPNLKRLVFSLWNCPQEPLSFGNVPLLSSLSLTDESMRWQKVIRLSQFLPNVLSIRDLHLNFLSEKIWVQPECPKLLAHVLRNLQVLNLDELPEGCDIAWTRFFIEAAPVLKELCITVWDHWCEMETDSVEREAQGFCDKTDVEWESSAPDGFRHYNLTKLTIYGFQPNDNFLGYIRHIMEAAVNLEDVSLYDRKVLECCEDLDPKIKVASTGYPEAIQEQELLKKQITEGSVMASPHIIHFRS